ncbi:hypothetical protein ACTFIR_003810 [Dictyostelium discoideum]
MTQYTAIAKYIRISPRKARLASALIRGLPVGQARLQLQHSNLKAGRLLMKTLDSAAATYCYGTSIKKSETSMSDKVEIVINTARPGLVIGKKGSEIDVLRNELAQLTGKEIWIEVEEIKRPDINAKVVADGIVCQLERLIPFRRANEKGSINFIKILQYK